MVALVAAVAALAVGLGLYLRPQKTEPQPPADGKASQRGKTTESPKVDPGRYFDWNAGTGAIADAIRPLLTARLVELTDSGRRIYRLATEVNVPKKGKAKVSLRSSAYWSDKVRFEAKQCVAAFNRLKERLQNNEEIPLNEEKRRWLRNVTVSNPDETTLVVEGFSSEKDLWKLLSSYALAPIRAKLVNENGPEAWKTTLGPYQPAPLLQKPVEETTTIPLTPNPYYYRGAAEQAPKKKISRLISGS